MQDLNAKLTKPVDRKYKYFFDRYVEKLRALMRQIKAERDKLDNDEAEALANVLGQQRIEELQQERDWFCAEALRLSRELK